MKPSRPKKLKYPTKTAAERQSIDAFLLKADFRDGADWGEFKALYKACEAAQDLALLLPLISRLDQTTLQTKELDDLGYAPSPATLAYMKRRARRFVRLLAETDPDECFDFSLALLAHTAAGKEGLDWRSQWITLEVLYGDSKRTGQNRHGRGSYSRVGDSVSIRVKEQLQAHLWDRRLKDVRALARQRGLCWEVYEACYATFARVGVAIPRPPVATIDRFVSSPSRFLHGIAWDSIEASFETTKPVNGRIVSKLYLNGAAQYRKKIKTLLAPPTVTDQWLQSFAREMLRLVRKRVDRDLSWSDAPTQAASLLIQVCPSQIHTKSTWPFINDWVIARVSAARRLVYQGIANSTADEFVRYLELLDDAGEEFSQPMMNQLRARSSTLACSLSQARRLVFSKALNIAAIAWDLLSGSQVNNEVVASVWTEVLRKDPYNVVRRHTTTSKHALELLSQLSEFPDALSSVVVHDVNLSLYFLKLKDARLSTLAFKSLSHAKPEAVFQWIQGAQQLSASRRQTLLTTLAEVWVGQLVPIDVAYALVTSTDTSTRSDAWWLMERVAPPQEWIEHLWASMSSQGSDVLASAFSSAPCFALVAGTSVAEGAASQLFSAPVALRHEVETDILLQWATLLGDGSAVLSVLNSMPPEKVAQFKRVLKRKLQSDAVFFDRFWADLATAVNADQGELLQHLDSYSDILELLLRLHDASLLGITNPLYSDILVRWVRRHRKWLLKDRRNLLLIALHDFPRVRAVALTHARSAGMDQPLAMSLMESSFPDCVRAAKRYFRASDHSPEYRQEIFQVLCDSPDRDVQDYAIEYFSRYGDEFDVDDAATRLSEHFAPAMQEFAASLSFANSVDNEEVSDFHRRVLRTRSRARRAKEIVKRHIEHMPTTDTGVLLELARSGVPRDAEWALQQLALAASKGEEIDDINVSDIWGI